MFLYLLYLRNLIITNEKNQWKFQLFSFFFPEECGSLAKPTNQMLTDVTITKTNNDLYCYIITGPKYLTDLTHLWKKNRESKVCLKRNETEGIIVQNTIGQSLLICTSREWGVWCCNCYSILQVKFLIVLEQNTFCDCSEIRMNQKLVEYRHLYICYLFWSLPEVKLWFKAWSTTSLLIC